MPKPLPGATAAVRVLTAAKVDFELCRYDHDPAQSHFGVEAVAQLGELHQEALAKVGEAGAA
ncbi:MAG: hypothetical protein LBL55_01895, partial [Propionibacteriaceae bacterium]|nr:hypothetical protein [Propionibacteriaceae bacterium]